MIEAVPVRLSDARSGIDRRHIGVARLIETSLGLIDLGLRQMHLGAGVQGEIDGGRQRDLRAGEGAADKGGGQHQGPGGSLKRSGNSDHLTDFTARPGGEFLPRGHGSEYDEVALLQSRR